MRGLCRRPTASRLPCWISPARAGDASEEPDLDLSVALTTGDPRREVNAAAAKLARDLSLERGVVLSVIVADRAFLEAHKGYSFLEAIAEEGVPL